jgi:DNA-binding winged helix-turn-helix (wHTH) protein/tetratricopeptide (TPR) repeat protein
MRRQVTTEIETELDLGRYELRRRGRRVKLERKSMELLIFLVSRRDQLVPREEIVARLWRSDLFVDTERNINNIVRKIRTALGDDAERPRFVETVVGKGYRFVGPLRVIEARYAKPEQELHVGHGERPSLAVLPLRVEGKAADERGLSLGFADGVAARLGALQGVDVLPAAAVLHVPPEASASEIAAHLGVRFVVQGAIRMSKGMWRLSVEMLDAVSQKVCCVRKCDLEESKLEEVEGEIAKAIAAALHRPLSPAAAQRPSRHSKDAVAYSEFMRGYRLSSSGDAGLLEEAGQHLMNAVSRDPGFSLAHATLSIVCATRHFEFDPASTWLERAEFHCRRALEIDADLPEGHVAKAFLLWGPSKNFQHLEAIAELQRALTLQKNLPHAYNRLGTILAHVGLLERAREMYERGRAFHPKKAVSHSIVQVYIWNREYDLAREEIAAWKADSPGNKYPVYFAPQLAMMAGEWQEAKELLEEAARALPEEPMIISLQGLYHALTGDESAALECMARACASPKSFGHAHHSHYQIACILAVLGRRKVALEWLERSVSTGFACWPFFLQDTCLHNLRSMTEFETLISSLQTKYPDHLGVL